MLLTACLTFTQQVKIMNLSSVIACAKLLKGSSDPRVLEQACGILRNLSTNNMAAGQISNKRAVQAANALLENEDAKVVERAAGTLRKCKRKQGRAGGHCAGSSAASHHRFAFSR